MCLMLLSCTKDKTDYQAVVDEPKPEHPSFQETASISFSTYSLRIEVPEGKFQTGYNPLRMQLVNRYSHQRIPANEVEKITLTPRFTDQEMTVRTGPHQRQINPDDQGYHSGFIIFPEASKAGHDWELSFTIRVADSTHHIRERIQVHEQSNPNLNMTHFNGRDGAAYIIALVAPRQPQVGENELIACIYRRDNQSDYSVAKNYTLLLDPRMPEASMGNHSSPNNRDLQQQDNGYYHGVVNYTMTGNWTLNFILLNEEGTVIKGTTVPTDFTPGIPGIKSELHIDIFF